MDTVLAGIMGVLEGSTGVLEAFAVMVFLLLGISMTAFMLMVFTELNQALYCYLAVRDQRAVGLSRAMLDGDSKEVAVLQGDMVFLKTMPFLVKMRLMRCDKEYPFFDFACLPGRLKYNPKLLAGVIKRYGKGLREGSYVACSWGGKDNGADNGVLYVAQKIPLPSGYMVYRRKVMLGEGSALDVLYGLVRQ